MPIPWTALVARIPIALPGALGSLGRQLRRARVHLGGALRASTARQDALFAYAFATNSVFLLLNVLIGAVFFRRAFELATEVRRSARSRQLPEPLLRDAIDP